MRKLKWITPNSLGIIEEHAYFEIQLKAKSTESSEVFYSMISGSIPTGVKLSDSGLLYGVANTLKSNTKEFDSIIEFTVRAWDSSGVIADKTFNFIVSTLTNIGIVPEEEFLGTFIDGEKFFHQINLDTFGQIRPITWRLANGKIPEGITISSDGKIHGFLGNKITDQTLNQYGWDKSAWDMYFLDATRPQNASVYQFTMEADDGIYQNRKSYKIEVLPRNYTVRADRTYPLSYDFSKLDASQNGYLPYIIEESKTLPQVRMELSRHDTNFAFKFNARDLDNDEIYYEITSPDNGGFDQDGEVGFGQGGLDSSDYPMPVGIGLNNQSGWYTGHFFKQNKTNSNHTFQIYARKKLGREYSGPKTNFNMTVLGDYNDEIHWITDSDLGTIDNGSFSSLRVQAVTNTNSKLYYRLSPLKYSRTPQGVVLLSTGELSGRVSFRHFSLDGGSLTLDQDKTLFDRQYSFTVIAHDLYFKYYSEKTFNLRVNVSYKEPYDSLYLRAMPNKVQRKFLKSIIESEYYFPSNLIYRSAVPWWGKKHYLEFLFLTGLPPGDLSIYLPALEKNHYSKTFTFGEVKTAAAIDENYNIIYEVVYLDVIDSQLGVDSKTGLKKYPQQDINLGKLSNFYSVNGVDQTKLCPNGLGNMSKQVIDHIPINEKSPLPKWMTSMQPNPNSISLFDPPLGYIPAVVLAYTEPGGSKTIAYRLKSNNVLFNNIEFTTDRYLLDNVLSKYYDITKKQFIQGIPCYLDQKVSVAECYRIKGNVDWAIDATYSQISGKLVSDLIAGNIFDGQNSVVDGDTVILIQSSGYISINDYSTGWVDYANNRIIPGYLNQLITGADNERSAVYQITIDSNGYLFLNVLELSAPGDIVTIKNGNIYGGKNLCLDHYAIHGYDITWREFKNTLIIDPLTNLQIIKNRKPTTFDSDSTRFVSNKDRFYLDPNVEDKYIKFPKTGVFI